MNLRPKKYDEIDFDSVESSEFAQKVLREKKCLRDIYVEMYQEMMGVKNRYLIVGGKTVEIGSGGGFIKDIFPEVVTSDVKAIRGVDMVFSADKLPFADNSVSAIFAVHVIHHIPDITRFCAKQSAFLCLGAGLFA